MLTFTRGVHCLVKVDLPLWQVNCTPDLMIQTFILGAASGQENNTLNQLSIDLTKQSTTLT